MIRERIFSRANRGTVDRSRARMNEKGAVDINQVDQALYRPDLGFKVTGEGYDEYKRGEGLFGKAYDEIIGSNKAALATNQGILGQINQSQTEISKFADKPLDQMYNEVKSGFKTATVGYAGKENYGSYQLPMEVLKEMQSGPSFTVYGFTRGNETIGGTVYPNRKIEAPLESATEIWIHPVLKNNDPVNGSQIAEAVGQVAQNVQTEFYKQMAPKIEAAKNSWSELETKKGEVNKYITTSEDTIKQTEEQKQLRDTTKAAYKDQYATSTAQRQALFRPWA